MKDGRSESASKESSVPARATQDSCTLAREWVWVNRSLWTERMLAALDTGVKGSKWFSLIDKVYRPQTLMEAWQQVAANKGAAGIDGQSIERFAANAERYLGELAEDLKEGRCRPEPVRRGEIPKAGGNTPPTIVQNSAWSSRSQFPVSGCGRGMVKGSGERP